MTRSGHQLVKVYTVLLYMFKLLRPYGAFR